MLERGRIMHVLSVICWVSASVTHHIAAYPTGESAFPDYSPSYDFVDEYLHNSDEDLYPSDSELGDLLWGILYQPSSPMKRVLPNGRPVVKRQQGWHVDLGKRQFYQRPDYSRRQQLRLPDYGQRLRAADHALQDETLKSVLSERQAGAYYPWGKRQQGWHSDYGKRNINKNRWYDNHVGIDQNEAKTSVLPVIMVLRPRPLRPAVRQAWNMKDMTRDRLMNNLNKRPQGWFAEYGKRSGNPQYYAESKRQQGWHSPYGKRQDYMQEIYGTR